MSEKNSCDFSKYNSMTNDELEEILRLDAIGTAEEELDADAISYVVEVLASRKQVITERTAEEAWESFQKDYMPEEFNSTNANTHAKAHRWRSRLIATAAAIALLITIPLTAKAFGWENLWSIIAKWANGTFSFVSNENTAIEHPSADDIEEYPSLQSLLASNGRDPSVVPTWVPEGFDVLDVRMDLSPQQENYSAIYQRNNDELRIYMYTHLDADWENIEINEDIIEIYERSGVPYYICSNMDELKVIWIIDSYECYISGNLSLEEMKQMINSIGKGK